MLASEDPVYGARSDRKERPERAIVCAIVRSSRRRHARRGKKRPESLRWAMSMIG